MDDDDQHARVVVKTLEEAGMECRRVVDAAACLAALRTDGPFDVVVLQQSLGSTTGFHLLLAARREGYCLPAIMLTEKGSERVAAAAVRAGVADYLIRDSNFSHLRALPSAIRRVLESRVTGPGRSNHTRRVEAIPPSDLRHLVLIDPLTGLYNRRFLQQSLEREFAAARRYGYPLACAIADLDHFKRINDTYGHLIGDEVLAKVAGLFQSNFRAPDLCFRFGGEELLVLMPHTSPRPAVVACERFLQTLRDIPIATSAGDLPLTASVGVACLHNDNFAAPSDMLAAADVALYTAKRQGRDRVVLLEACGPLNVKAA
ncbi:MAG: diguanylate cyclase response regulator [Armatimonadetes bacterium]|nr:diguanylate cyclase response regulator [Armatimonadota bacterium]